MKTDNNHNGPSPAEEPLESLRDFGRGWDRFWFAPSDPTTLGLMRLLSGIVVLYCTFCYSFDLLSYVSPREAWLDEKVTTPLRTYWQTQTFPDNWTGPPIVVRQGQESWSVFFHLYEPHWIWTAHILILIATLLFTVGFATRITSVITFLGAVSYIWRAQTSLFGLDAMMIVLLFYLMIAPSGAALSIDRWLQVRRERKRLRDPNAVVPLRPLASATFATRLFQIHFCIIYMAAGTAKLLGAAWWNGTALWACYANYSFAPMRVGLYQDMLVFLCNHRWLWELVMSGGAIFTIFIELSFSYLVWLPRWRWIMLTGSVMLHTGIGLFMGLVTFSLAMLCMVMCFIPPEATKLFLARVAENWRKLRHTLFGPAAVGATPQPAR
jgi:hypothetical protein